MDQSEQKAVAGPPVNRFLVWLVVGLGIIMGLLLLLMVGLTVYKIRQPKPDAVTQPLVPSPRMLSMVTGDAITGATLNGDRLVITSASKVYVIDVTKGRVVLEVAAR